MGEYTFSSEKYDDALSLLDRALNLAREIFNPGNRIIALSTIAQTKVSIGQREDSIALVDEARNLLYDMEQADDLYSEALVAMALATARINHYDDTITLLEQSIQHTASIDLGDKRAKSLRNIAQTALDIGNDQLAATIVPLISPIDDRVAILKAMIEQHETNQPYTLKLIQSAWQTIETYEKLWSLLPLMTVIPMNSPQLVIGMLDTEVWVNEQLKRLG
ncbi:tetratricopeptide repeat protein [Herpetosiphon llansteffanensis]|uniref:tetratricopeptide repeat protein n=1 Tax=Herpetosiphon llansteffanensis TaxID=2094568 RepID=UPI000D7C93F4|nr:tetratricopeptide repeat protein [Herpetosiphon llansteffanensis]